MKAARGHYLSCVPPCVSSFRLPFHSLRTRPFSLPLSPTIMISSICPSLLSHAPFLLHSAIACPMPHPYLPFPLSFSSLLISTQHSPLNFPHSQEQKTTSRTHKHPPLQNKAIKMTTVYFSSVDAYANLSRLPLLFVSRWLFYSHPSPS